MRSTQSMLVEQIALSRTKREQENYMGLLNTALNKYAEHHMNVAPVFSSSPWLITVSTDTARESSEYTAP